MSPIYLDNNATTPPLPEVLEAMVECWRQGWGNPGSRHRAGRRARQVLEDARESIAAILGADPEELIFTSGGTESINTALFGLAGRPGEVWTTPGEHPATAEACRTLQTRGWRWRQLPLDGQGRLLPPVFDNADNLRLVSLIAGHNETGVLQDLAPWREACGDRGVPWLVDAVQVVGKVPVDFHGLGATALSFGAHKFHGPRGVGGLLLRRGTKLVPYLYGGHQESNRRAGTEPVPLIAGMAKALELWHARAAECTATVTALRDDLQARLVAACPPVVVHGGEASRLPNTLSSAFPGLDGEALLVALDLAGVACSLGTTCASGSAEPAPVLAAMGVPADVAQATVRLTLSRLTTPEEVARAAAIIAETVTRLRAM